MPQYHLPEYIATQQQETYRSFIIHAPAMSHKTALARSMHDKLGVYLFDLQANFVADAALAHRINTFGPRDLEELLLTLEDIPANVVVIDNMDFLLNVWTPGKRKEFVGMIDLRLKFGLTSKTFIFIIQSDPVITRQSVTNTGASPAFCHWRRFSPYKVDSSRSYQ